MTMANLPSPRALPQILGGMVDEYLSRLDSTGIAPGVKSLRVGSSILAFMEAVAQSQARGSQDLMNLLNADDIDRAKGARLDRIGRKEGVPRRGETYARGSITINDTRFLKVATSVYPGKPSPIVGTTTINVGDASTFPASGQVYVGRGTSNYEGPLAYSAKTAVTSGPTTLYWKLTITGGTLRYHNIGESVILAQGGDRAINVGQVVGTPQGSATDAVLFNVTQRVVMLDGEVELDNVPIVAQKTGSGGNQNTGAIRVVTAPAFTGMAVTNSLPIQNGMPVEDDDHYRARIKAVRANRSKGTPDAILARAYGIQAQDENSTIVSARLAVLSGKPSTLFIDDGAAYEEKDSGVDYEVLIDSANGGETTFHLAFGRPVARATLKSLQAAPYALSNGASLSISVGGVAYTHSFAGSDFSDITNATAYEVVASINANSTLGFNARTIEGGTKVAIFSRALCNEDLNILAPQGTDASVALGLPQVRIDTLRVYKNDTLLFKDGQTAALSTTARPTWQPLATGETLKLNVDGTGLLTYVITDNDFVNAGTGFTTVAAAATVDAWAAVLNAKVPGITAAVVGSTITVASNRGASARASLAIDQSSTLVVKGVFSASTLSAAGKSYDYTLDRNLGVIQLVAPLAQGDRLSAGTPFTRAYLQSADLGTGTVTLASDATLWFAIDGDAVTIADSLDSTQTLTLTTSTTTPVRRVTSTFTGTGAAAFAFKNIKLGDWFFVTDAATFQLAGNFAAGFHFVGAWRVSNVDPLGQWFEYETVTDGVAHTATNVGTAYATTLFVRTPVKPFKVTVPGSLSYSPQDIVDFLNFWLQGASASLYQNTRYRVTTNTYGINGDISLVAQTASAAPLGLTPASSVNDLPHYAAVESGNTEIGTPPIFFDTTVPVTSGWTETSLTKHLLGGTLSVTVASVAGIGNARRGALPQVNWLHPLQATTAPSRWGTNDGTSSILSFINGVSLTVDNVYDPPISGTFSDRLLVAGSFHLGPESVLNVELDGQDDRVFAINMFRRLVPDPAVPYGPNMKFLDLDNPDANGNPQPLVKAFGTSFDWSNFILYSHSRCVTHSADSTRSVLWRLSKFWNGECGTVRYSAPTLPGQAVRVNIVEPNFDINIQLPSGAPRGFRLTANSQMRAVSTTDAPLQVAVMVGFTGCTLARAASTVTCTPTLPTNVVGHGYLVGQVISLTSTDPANFPSGSKTITAVTTTTFSYTEAGAAVAGNSYPAATITWPNDSAQFVTGGVVVGDFVNFDGAIMASVKGAYRVTAVGAYFIKVLKLAGNTPADTNWHPVTSPATNIVVYPLDQSVSGTGATPPTAAFLIGQVNSLSPSTITGVLGGTGAGTIVQASVEEAIQAGVDPSAALLEGFMVVAAGPTGLSGNNYMFSAKYTLPAFTSVDWANEQFRLVPSTAKNVADWLAHPAANGLSVAGANLLSSSNAGRVQIASGTLGTKGSVRVAGGSANSLSVPVKGQATNVSNLFARVSVPANSDLDAGLTQGMAVSIDAAQPQPKVTGWGAATSFSSIGGLITVGGGSSAWAFSAARSAPVFGGNFYFEKHGRYVCMTSADQKNTFGDVPVDDWLTVTDATGFWSPGAAIQDHPRYGVASVKLQDGRYMVMGGCTKYSDSAAGSLAGATLFADVDIWDPVAKTWTAANSLPAARSWGAAAVLSDGSVLYSGGIVDTTQNVSNVTYIWTPATGTWATSGNLVAARARHTATTMSDGKVLAIGGHTNAWATNLSSMESYSLGVWTTLTTSALPAGVVNHTTVPYGFNQLAVITNASFFTMSRYPAPTWSGIAGLTGVHGNFPGAARLADGRILVFGGNQSASTGNAATDIIDLVTGTATAGPPMNWGRGFPCGAVALADGRIAAIGGVASNLGVAACEVYDPVANTWSWLAPGNNTHGGPSFLNSDGTISAMPTDTVGAGLTNDVLDLTRSIAKGNVGTFRVVARSANSVWFENPNAVNEVAQSTLVFRTYSSVMPGDIFTVRTDALGSLNVTSFPVSGVNLNNKATFSTTPAMADFGTTTPGSPAVSLISVTPPKPARLIMKVAMVSPDPNDPTLVTLWLTPGCSSYTVADLPIDRIGATAGCTVSPLDKLAFPTGAVAGTDAYRYNTGLIAEANRVLYGDLSDRQSYPGYIAAGQVINIEGSLVRRIRLSLAVRVRPGADVESRIKDAVAKVINTAGPNPIPLSAILRAATGVSGVISVVPLSPAYDVAHDTIPVQPYETPRVLDLADIQVSFIGQ
jgi:hypothetical protein